MRGILAAVALTAILAGGGAARAAVTVLGGGLAESCSRSAKTAADAKATARDAIDVCTLALENEALNSHDLAGTHVNRGVLSMVAGRYADARSDFDTAIAIKPDLGEAFANRGGALIGLSKDADGIKDINRGLELGTEEPEKSYYNRALAEERLGDLKAAYFDYLKASELKPDWDAPKREMQRFTVTRK